MVLAARPTLDARSPPPSAADVLRIRNPSVGSRLAVLDVHMALVRWICENEAGGRPF